MRIPSQITIFGQSAGAASAAVHMLSPYSKGLFSKVIIESNPFALPMKTVAEVMLLRSINHQSSSLLTLFIA